MGPAISVKRLTVADSQRLEELCVACTEFFQLIEGQPGGRETAAEILGPLSPSIKVGKKSIFGLEKGNELIGVVEVLAGYPLPDEWYVGLFLLRPDARRAGAGTSIWSGLRQWMNLKGVATVRLVVQKQNPGARRFWERQGLTVEKETVTNIGTIESQAWLLRCSIADEGSPGDQVPRSQEAIPKMEAWIIAEGECHFQPTTLSGVAHIKEDLTS